MTEQLSVVEALSKVMEDVRAVAKADRNTQQNYSFRGVDAVMNAVGPALRTHGVVVMPICEEANYRDVTTSTGKPSRECTVLVRYRFYGPKGDFIEAVTPGESMDFGDKGAPKAMSVAYRIVLLQALCLPTHEAEPDAATYERATGARTVTAARDELTGAIHRHKWSEQVVKDKFAGIYPAGLDAETDVERIDKFRKWLTSQPQHELVAAEPASANEATS